ncbi:MAG: cation diffusion facilitator family transporter [Tepidisphaeraceae bacterium]
MTHPNEIVYVSERRAASISVAISVALLVVKFAAYMVTGSAAVFSDALESIVNVLASILALYSIIVAHAPADREHPYGHGKIEFLSAGFEGGMMLVAAVVIVARAIEALIRSKSIEQVNLGLTLLVVAMAINGVVGMFLLNRGRAGGSITLEADGKHLLADAVTSAVVLMALVAVKVTGLHRIDAVAALLVAAYVAYAGLGLMRRSAAGLMDEQDLADDRLLRGILDAHVAGEPPRICSYHKLRHRHSGRYHWVDFHVMVPPGWDVERGHRVASSIEYEIEQALGEGNATAHVEPCADSRCPTCLAELPAA